MSNSCHIRKGSEGEGTGERVQGTGGRVQGTGPLARGLRSRSNPDLRPGPGTEAASPYLSLERLLDQDGEDRPVSSNSSNSSSSSSHELLGGEPLFRRPPRAAGLRRRLQGGEQEPRGRQEAAGESGEVDSEARGKGGRRPDCAYMRRQQEEVMVNCQPAGFDGRLAAAAVERGRSLMAAGKEEHFGSDSEDSTSSSSSSSEGADF
jgi:hypothetical protein